MKYFLLFLFILLNNNVWAVTCSPPTSTYTYISGTTIQPNQVQTNENNLYSYVQSGVCNYQPGSISQSAISSTAGILYTQLNLSGGILPSDFNTTTTTSIYQLENVLIPNGGTFNYGTNHAGDLLVDNGSQFVRLPDVSPVGKALISKGSTTTPIYGFPSGQLGAWQNPTGNTVYQASTDLIVTGQGGSAGTNSISGLTDSNSTPSTIRVNQETFSASGADVGITFPVRKGDYWEVASSSLNSTTVYAIAIGS
jgi:hypothetical protein